MTPLSVTIALLLGQSPIECPRGSALVIERSEPESKAGSTWFSCERDGVRHGPFVYASNGVVMTTAEYRDGLQDGLEQNRGLSGRVVANTRFRAGLKHGLEHWFFDDGATWRETNFAHGMQHGRHRVWRPDGTLIVESEWLEGKAQRFVVFFRNGARRFAADAPLPNTTMKEWNERGELLRTTTLVNGHPPSDPAEGDDRGMLTCPEAQLGKVRRLGVHVPNGRDMCEGGPVPTENGAVAVVVTVKRTLRGAVDALGCTFVPLRGQSSDDVARMQWDSTFHSMASNGNE